VPELRSAFPTVARFVEGQGWIEIGDHEGEGWVVRALDYGGMIFETRTPRTLDQAMTALEKGLAEFLREHG
jgi:hypothetical protein